MRAAARGAVLGLVAMTAIVSACTGARGPDNEPSTAPTSTPSAAGAADGELLSAETPAGTPQQLAERDLCVNASDYTYLVTAFAQRAPVDGSFEDPRFARAGTERIVNTAVVLADQLPFTLEPLGEGLTETWIIFRELAEAEDYAPTDAEAVNEQFDERTAQYQEGNGRLVGELQSRCAADDPEYAQRLTVLP